MSGIVSLLDDMSDHAIRALWGELAERYGLRAATQRVPYPHCSYHVAEDYDLAKLGETLRRVATQTEPFATAITGLSGFEAPEPVLYLAVERNAPLTALHAALWDELARDGMARQPMPLYASSSWVPHITLAQGDLTLEALRALRAEWAGRDLRRELWVSDLTLLYRATGEPSHTPLMRFSLGSVGDHTTP